MRRTAALFLLMLIIFPSCSTAAAEAQSISIERTLAGNARIGGTLNITILVKNTGLEVAKNIVVVEQLNSSLELVGGELRWSTGELKPNQTAAFSYAVKPKEAGTILLPPTSVAYDGKEFKGKAIYIEVPQPLSPSFVFFAGLIAGFNPCVLAILAFMVSILLTTAGRMKAVYTTFAFSMGIFAVYLIVGMGLFRALAGGSVALQETFKLVLVIIIFLLGIWHVYDSYYITRKAESSFTTPRQIVDLAEKVGKKASYPSAFLLGALFSLVKAPCVGAIYFAILELIIEEGMLSQGLLHLALYNLGLVLPIMILGCAMALGLSPQKVDRFRKEKRALLRLITGAILIILAVLLALDVI